METKVFIELSNGGKQLTINGNMDLLSQLLRAVGIEPVLTDDKRPDITCPAIDNSSPKIQEMKNASATK